MSFRDDDGRDAIHNPRLDYDDPSSFAGHLVADAKRLRDRAQGCDSLQEALTMMAGGAMAMSELAALLRNWDGEAVVAGDRRHPKTLDELLTQPVPPTRRKGHGAGRLSAKGAPPELCGAFEHGYRVTWKRCAGIVRWFEVTDELLDQEAAADALHCVAAALFASVKRSAGTEA